jgi:hypothetical protein
VIGRWLALTACFAAATIVAGWWGIPMVGLAAGVWAARHGSRLTGTASVAAVSAVSAWAGLLAWTAMRGPLSTLIATLGQLVGVPGSMLILLALCFAAILAWSAALAGTAVGQKRRGE